MKHIWTVEVDSFISNRAAAESLNEAMLAMAKEWKAWCDKSGADTDLFSLDNLKVYKMALGVGYSYEIGEPDVFERDVRIAFDHAWQQVFGDNQE